MLKIEDIKTASNITIMKLINNQLSDINDLRFESDEDSIFLFNESIKNLELLRTELFDRWSKVNK